MLNFKRPRRKKKVLSEFAIRRSRSKILYTCTVYVKHFFLANAIIIRDYVNGAACFANIRKARFHVISSRMTASHDRHLLQRKKKEAKKASVQKHAIRIMISLFRRRVSARYKKKKKKKKLHLVSGIP